MAKIKYCVKEHDPAKKNGVGTHSFYASPLLNGTLSHEEIVQEACKNTSIEPSIMKAAVAEYMKAVQANVLKGFRCPVGENFLTVYPYLSVSVTDKDAEAMTEGKEKVATAKMVKASLKTAKSRLAATVAVKFSDEFERNVIWQKVDSQGAEITDEDITNSPDKPDDTPSQQTPPAQGEDPEGRE